MQFAHVMLRVLDLDRSIKFYCEHLGMRLLRRKDYPSGRFTLAFVGYADEEHSTAIELTYNWDQELPYEKGNGFGHLALRVTDAYQTCKILKEQGIEITREPGPMKHGSTVIAFVKDPDGYTIELIQKAGSL